MNEKSYNPEEYAKAVADFVNRVWKDDAFRARLESDPKSALAELGGKVADGVELKVVFDTDKVKYLHIPSSPPEGEISDSDLMGAHGGLTITFPATEFGLSCGVSVTFGPQ
jgi:Nitrile hydratase, alpha chain